MMCESSIAGSLSKPAGLAETNMPCPAWSCTAAVRDATLLAIKQQEDEGIDFDLRVEMGIHM